MKSPVIWLGGKNRLAPRLNSIIPPHSTYVEVFGGGASLLFLKDSSPVEVYNDIDEDLVNFFRVLQNPRKVKLLENKLNKTPYSRAEFNKMRIRYSQSRSDIETAYPWFCVMQMSFGSLFGKSWGYSIHGSVQGVASCVHRFRSSVKLLDQACERLRNVIVECNDWQTLCARYNDKNTLLFLDPPYLQETRRNVKYRHELSDDDHTELIHCLSNSKSKIMICGYDNRIYRSLLSRGWWQINWPHRCCLNNRRLSDHTKQGRIESVWMNFKL
jgi:DNA adenine methylase